MLKEGSDLVGLCDTVGPISHDTANRSLPFLLLRLMVLCPFFVFILTRKPWVRFLRRFDGWYVIDIKVSIRIGKKHVKINRRSSNREGWFGVDNSPNFYSSQEK